MERLLVRIFKVIKYLPEIGIFRFINIIFIYLIVKVKMLFRNEFLITDIWGIVKIYYKEDPLGFLNVSGIYELEETVFFIELFPKNNKELIIFDIGSGIGHFTLLFGKLGFKVHSFEPNPFSRMIQKKQIELNGFNNIILNDKGVGEHSTKKIFKFNEGFKGYLWGSFVNSGSNPSNQKETEIITIDEYVNNNSINDISFVKIDTEGFEYPIFLGMEKTIEKFHPIMMIEMSLSRMVEFNDNRYLKQLEIIKKSSYEIYVLEDKKLIHYSWPYKRVMNWFLIPEKGLNRKIDNIMEKLRMES